MKVIKNKWIRLALYVLGFICSAIVVATIAVESIKFAAFPGFSMDKTYEQSAIITSNIEGELEILQNKAQKENVIYNLDILDTEITLYDYDKVVEENGSEDDIAQSTTINEMFADKDVYKQLSSYNDDSAGEGSVYNAYPDITAPKDNKFIRLSWKNYFEIIKNNTYKYSSARYDDMLYSEEFADDESEEKKQYEMLDQAYGLENYEGIVDGDYFKFINGKLFCYNVSSNSIYFENLGTTLLPGDSLKNEYVYFPYSNDIEDFKDVSELESFILSSYIYRSDIEVVYSTLDINDRAKMSKGTDVNGYYSYGYNTAYSLDGETVSHAWICDEEGLEDVKRTDAKGYNVTFAELCDLYRANSNIFVCYDAKTKTLEQWYKDSNGEKVSYDYISSKELSNLTSESDNSFVLGINMSDSNGAGLFDKTFYDLCRDAYLPIWLSVLSILVLLTCVVLLIIGEPAKLYLIDRMPYIIWGMLYSGVISALVMIVFAFFHVDAFWLMLKNDRVGVSLGFFSLVLVAYLSTAAVLMNVIRRIKVKKFLEGFIIVLLIKFIYKSYMKNRDRIEGKKRLFAIFIGFMLVSILLLIFLAIHSAGSFIAALVLLALDIAMAVITFRYMTDIDKLLKTSKGIEAGDLDTKINVDDLSFNAREMGKSLNNLGDGLSKAIDSSIRDERTKAELITNVSHDIKTPLTSIINYVDLLKKEQIDNEKASEYIDVLDQKSQRLKQLILDLIEASKTSTGNIELECMNLNLVELINQGLGEYEEKFGSLSLEVVKGFKVENAIINADGRRVFRIIDNILNNVSKYAQPNTRVYMDLNVVGANEGNPSPGRVVFSVKNVSKEMLNISAEELTERFVRGDKSRYTEGSGLGLSIAKNLTELQNGSFDITIDGDLFKVDISFPLVEAQN